MDEIVIWRAARLLIDQYRAAAIERGCARLRELTAAGDIEGCRVWARILAATNELRRTERRDGEAVN
jgi:hypothetical protein